MRNFWDQTGGLWFQGELVGKVGGAFTSTATQHGGQETTLIGLIQTLLHHGMVVVGLPYAFQGQMTLDEITGGSALRRHHHHRRRRLASAQRESNWTAPATRASTSPRSRRSCTAEAMTPTRHLLRSRLADERAGRSLCGRLARARRGDRQAEGRGHGLGPLGDARAGRDGAGAARRPSTISATSARNCTRCSIRRRARRSWRRGSPS